MRLAIFHNQPPGGARRGLYEIGKRLARHHHVDVFTLSSADESSRCSRDFAHRVAVTPYVQRPHVRLGLYLNDYRTWLDLRDLDSVSQEAARQIYNGRYDAVLVEADRYIGAPFVLRYLKVANVFYCQHPPRRFIEPICRPTALPLSRWERARLLWRWPASRLLERLTQRAEFISAQQAGRMVTSSHYTRAYIRRYYGREAAVCYLGVDSNFFCPDSTMSRRHEIMSVGALEPHKGFDFLIRTIARCRTRPRLRIKGGGWGHHARMGRHLMTLATRLGVELEIEPVSNDLALRDCYRQAALVAYTPHFEPLGLVPLEAMACETPVVGVAEGGVKETITNGVTGLLVPRDEQKAAAAIDELLADTTRCQLMGRAGREDVMNRWTWDATASGVEEHLIAQASGE